MRVFVNIFLTFISLMFLGLGASAEELPGIQSTSSLELIENTYQAGGISLADKLFYSIQAISDPDELPEEFRSEGRQAIKSGTPLINLIYDNWSELSPEQQAKAATYLARPELDSSYISPYGKFMIHYTLDSIDSVPNEDLDLNGVADYVERIGLYADSTYRFFHDNIGYLVPPDDGDGYYDIYLKNLSAIYGITYREDPGDSSWSDYSSYIKVNSTHQFAEENDDPEGRIIGAQKVTVAHEYYHAAQLANAFVSGDGLWWTEGTAAFQEDAVYEEVNDNYNYLSYFFNFPDTFLIDTSPISSYHDYSTFIFPSYLSEKYGHQVIRRVWEYLRYYDVVESIDSALELHQSSMKTDFPEFTVWNYFTGDRADTLFHNDSPDYPHIVIDNYQSVPVYGLTPINPPDGLASNYIMCDIDSDYNGLLHIGFDGDNSVEWSFSYVTFSDGEYELTVNCDVNSLGKTDCGIYNFKQYDSILFIPCVVSPWRDDNDYELTTFIYPFGDVNGSGFHNILDITHLINYIYFNGIPPKYDVQMGDVDCSGAINLIDVSYLINTLYHGGPLPCPDL